MINSTQLILNKAHHGTIEVTVPNNYNNLFTLVIGDGGSKVTIGLDQNYIDGLKLALLAAQAEHDQNERDRDPSQLA